MKAGRGPAGWIPAVLLIVALLLFAGCVVAALAAIWVVGDDSSRWAGTAAVLGTLGAGAILAALAVTVMPL